jgi:hypothetical protein
MLLLLLHGWVYDLCQNIVYTLLRRLLTAQDISVVVDLSDAEIGAQIYAAVIQVNTDAVVGSIGNYEVYVSVQMRTPLTPSIYGTEG